MRRRSILFALVVGELLALLATPGRARACECRRMPVPVEAWLESSLVVFGTIQEVAEGHGPGASPAQVATIVATDVRKGSMAAGERVTVTTPSAGKSCGLRFEEKESWLIFARMGEGQILITDFCGLSRKVDELGLVRRYSPREGEPYWDGLLALAGGDLTVARSGLETAVASDPRSLQPRARKALGRVRRLQRLHEGAMGALEKKDYPRVLALSRQIEKVPVPFLGGGHWKDEPLLRALREKARMAALAALDAKDWPTAYRHARIVFDAGDEVEGRSITALLEHRARPFYDQGSRLLRKKDPAKRAEGRKMLKMVVAMTGPGWRLHQPAKDKLRGKRRKRSGAGVPKIPKQNRR